MQPFYSLATPSPAHMKHSELPYSTYPHLYSSTSRHPNGNRECIGGDNEKKESLISEEEVQKFNRNSIATEYLNDDEIDKARERMRCAALGAIGSEMGYGCGCSQTDDNKDEDEYKSKAITGPNKMRVESNGAVSSYSDGCNQRHSEEAPTIIQGRMSTPVGGAENSYVVCETFQHRPNQGKAKQNGIPHTENFQTVSSGLPYGHVLRNPNQGRETQIAISRHKSSYSHDFRNFLARYYNGTRRDFQGSFTPFTTTSQPVTRTPNKNQGG